MEAPQLERSAQMKINPVCVLLFLVLFSGCIGAHPRRTPYRYLIPNGYIGWVEVTFGLVDEPELPVQEGFRIVRFSKEGILKTSSKLENGWAKDEYYYSNGDIKQKLSDGYQTGMINAGSSGVRAGNRQSLWFFVGTYDQYMKYGYENGATPNIGPIKP